MSPFEGTVRVIVDLLVRREYEAVEAVTRGKRLNADQLARAVNEYGRTLVPPGEGWWLTVEVAQFGASSNAFYVAAPLWTEEEGRSDLTLELVLEEHSPGIYYPEVLDLHVL